MCEGYTDVIGFFQAGVPRAVATCGTALAEEHFTLLRNFARRIVLAYDADGAGQSATSRVYEWERGTRSTWRWPTCPAAATPGTWPAPTRGAWPGPWRRPGRSCSSGSTACWARATSPRPRAGPGLPKRPSTAVAEHPDDLVRDQYVMQLADRCRLDPARLRERLEHLRAHPPARTAGPAHPCGSPDEPPTPGLSRGRRRSRWRRRRGATGSARRTALRPGPGSRR